MDVKVRETDLDQPTSFPGLFSFLSSAEKSPGNEVVDQQAPHLRVILENLVGTLKITLCKTENT